MRSCAMRVASARRGKLVLASDAEQDEHARADPADDLARHLDPLLAHPLHGG